jgi:aspartate aminotransferase-like enzyme
MGMLGGEAYTQDEWEIDVVLIGSRAVGVPPGLVISSVPKAMEEEQEKHQWVVIRLQQLEPLHHESFSRGAQTFLFWYASCESSGCTGNQFRNLVKKAWNIGSKDNEYLRTAFRAAIAALNLNLVLKTNEAAANT